MLGLKDGLDLLEGRITRANAHWTFMFTVDIAVVGWLVTRTIQLATKYKVAAICMMVCFYVFNLWAILRAQREMVLLDREVKKIVRSLPHDHMTEYGKHLVERSYKSFPLLTVPIYLGLNVAILVVIWIWPS